MCKSQIRRTSATGTLTTCAVAVPISLRGPNVQSQNTSFSGRGSQPINLMFRSNRSPLNITTAAPGNTEIRSIRTKAPFLSSTVSPHDISAPSMDGRGSGMAALDAFGKVYDDTVTLTPLSFDFPIQSCDRLPHAMLPLAVDCIPSACSSTMSSSSFPNLRYHLEYQTFLSLYS